MVARVGVNVSMLIGLLQFSRDLGGRVVVLKIVRNYDFYLLMKSFSISVRF